MKVKKRKPYLLHTQSILHLFLIFLPCSCNICLIKGFKIRPPRQAPLQSTDGPLSLQSVRYFWSTQSGQEPQQASRSLPACCASISPGHCSCEAGLKVQGVAPPSLCNHTDTGQLSFLSGTHTYSLPLASDNPLPAALCLLHYHIQAAYLARLSLKNPARQSKPSASATHLKSNQLTVQGKPHSVVCKPPSSTQNGCRALISGGFQREVNFGAIFGFRNRK